MQHGTGDALKEQSLSGHSARAPAPPSNRKRFPQHITAAGDKDAVTEQVLAPQPAMLLSDETVHLKTMPYA